MKTIESDLYRWNLKKKNRIPQVRFVYYKRKCEKWRNKFFLIFCLYRLIYRKYQIKYCTDIPASLKVGQGFKIRHLGGIVINPDAKLGANVDLLNGVLIGSQDRGPKKGVPHIGDNVFIGTNSIIVGKITIGNNVLIAPGSYVNFDVPNDSIVIGNPGKIIPCEDATLGYIENPVGDTDGKSN